MMEKVVGLLNDNAPKTEVKKEPTTSGFRSDEIFGMMATYLSRGEGKHLVPKLQAVLGFDILQVKGGKPVASFVVDLKTGQGSVRKDSTAGADAVFTLTDADFEQLSLGNLNP
jgi:hypothetical protein